MIPVTGRGPPPPHQLVYSGLWLKYAGIWLNSEIILPFCLFRQANENPCFYSYRRLKLSDPNKSSSSPLSLVHLGPDLEGAGATSLRDHRLCAMPCM